MRIYGRTFKIGDKCVAAYRLIYEIVHGVNLGSKDIIHHKDGNHLNDHYTNLEITTRAKHVRTHPEIETARIKAKTVYFFDRQEIIDLYKKYTMTEIARIKGVSISPIQDFIRKNKIKLIYKCNICEKNLNLKRRCSHSLTNLCVKCYQHQKYERNKFLSTNQTLARKK